MNRSTRHSKQTASSESTFVAIAKEFSREPGVTMGGTGFGASGLKVHGRIFAMISSKGLFVVKLPKERVDELVRLGTGERFSPRAGRQMKEWLALDDQEARWPELAREAFRFVNER